MQLLKTNISQCGFAAD